MSEKYPLFPTLTEDGEIDAQVLINSFREELIKCANDALGRLYVNISRDIESDSWDNFRNCLMDGLKNYSNRKIQGDYDFKEIRQAILREYRDEIIDDLNQDMVGEIESLKKQIELLQEARRY